MSPHFANPMTAPLQSPREIVDALRAEAESKAREYYKVDSHVDAYVIGHLLSRLETTVYALQQVQQAPSNAAAKSAAGEALRFL